MKRISIIGAGDFGLAMAFVLSKNHSNIIHIYSRSDEKVHSINQNGSTENFPDIALGVVASDKLEDVLDNVDYIFLTVPSKAIKENIESIAKIVGSNWNGCIVSCSKGLNNDKDNFFYSDYIESKMPGADTCVLSGPSFAKEIIQGVNTVVSIACKKASLAERIEKELFEGSNLHLVPSSDIIGVQILGAFKNFIGIRSGIEEGFGDSILSIQSSDVANLEFYNKTASLMNNLVSECKFLMKESGCQDDTIFSPAGLGDIFLTCSSFKSRNRMFGYKLGGSMAKFIVSSVFNNTKEDVLNRFMLDKEYIAEIANDSRMIKLLYQDFSWDEGTIEGLKAVFSLRNYSLKKEVHLLELEMLYKLLFSLYK